MSIAYHRRSPGRISAEVDQTIRQELGREKVLVGDKRLPISSYNYTALRDRLEQKGIQVSVNTIIKRAKEVVTTAIGEMIQHDASLHL